jgi:hypothetical protein
MTPEHRLLIVLGKAILTLEQNMSEALDTLVAKLNENKAAVERLVAAHAEMKNNVAINADAAAKMAQMEGVIAELNNQVQSLTDALNAA